MLRCVLPLGWPLKIGEKIARHFAVPAPVPLIKDAATHDLAYKRWSRLALFSITIGYCFYYTTRGSLGVTKKALLDEGLVDTAELGRIGFGLLAAYAVGKLVNGFLGDRVHLSRFFLIGLLLSALTNICFGVSSSYLCFAFLWALNGWFQSVGATTSGVTLTSWFQSGRLGTLYSLWSVSHNLGEGLTFVLTAALVSKAGWRWGFLGPGIVCVLVSLALVRIMPDRPQSLGLRPPQQVKKPPPENTDGTTRVPTTAELQLEALRNPLVWLIGLSSACMYAARYGLSNWGVLYLQEVHHYSLVDASSAVSMVPIIGIAGTLSSGPISDWLFAARRGPASLFFGALLVLAMCVLFLFPVHNPLVVQAALGAAGFAIGGQLLFLGGLSAAELCSRRAAGAALGIVGGVSYVGAAVQDYVSGRLLQGSGHGAMPYDFGKVKLFWIGAAVASLLLSLPLFLNGSKHPDHH
jgi:OPA family sugar phosphate sensor protein UhpC-like MFS transporter